MAGAMLKSGQKSGLKSALKSGLTGLLRGLGYRVIRDGELSLRNHYAEDTLGLALRLARPDMVIDVGGNEGQYYHELRHTLGFAGPICTFEPNPALYQALKARSAADPAWHVFPYAAGAEPGELVLNLTASSTFGSLLTPTDAQVGIEGNRVVGQARVPVRRLDSLGQELAACGPGRRIFLKLDTQGFDLQAFAGASGLLDRIVAVQSEVSVIPIYDGMPDYMTAIATYRAAGFELGAVMPVSLIDGRDIEFDCVFYGPGVNWPPKPV